MNFVRDPNAKSLSLFCTDPKVATVDLDLVTNLVALSDENGKCNARICLHTSPESNFHEMIILERRGYYYPPHKHVDKGQSCHIIVGEAACFVFDETGKVMLSRMLRQNGTFLFRVGDDQYHMIVPLTDYAIYHEAKPGPFLSTGDSVFADWAPKREDKDAVAEYLVDLIASV